MKNIMVIIGIFCTILLNCIYAGAQVEQPKLIATLKIDSINRISVVLENVGLDTILLRSRLYINAAEKNSRLMFYYKTSLNDAWETWERYTSVEPLNVDGGKIELLPNRHKTIFLGKSPFDSCFLKIELATLYRTSKTSGIIKLESNATYIPRYQPIKEPKVGARSRRKALRVERVERIGGFDREKLERSFGLVRFRSSTQARYALDLGDESWYLGSVKMDSFYKEFARGYIAPWKLIPTGERDVVEAYYEGSKDIDLSRVRFASTPDSPALPADYDEARKAWTLTLPATKSNSSYEVFALYQGKVIGRLRMVSYPKQSYKLRLVPVNGQSLGDGSRLSQQMNSIYNKYGVSFTLYESEGVSSELKAKNLSQDLRKLQEDYEAQHSLSGNEVCLFILSTELSKGSKYEELEGLMPRGKRFGYIFVGNSPNEESLARILAHELGHGLFTLQHTFDDEYGGKKSKGKTQNLMDYTEGATELAAFQWNVMANTALFTALDREKESQKVRFEGLVDGTNSGITPSGKVIRSVEATDKQKTAILGISADSHFVKSITLFDGTKRINSYNWDKSLETYISSNGDRIEDASDIVLTYNSESTVNSARLYKLVSGEKCFYQYIDVSFTSGDLSSLKIPNSDWNTALLWNASESCTAEFISKRVLKRDREAYSPEQIKAEQEKLKELSAATPIDELIDRLQGYHIYLANHADEFNKASKISFEVTEHLDKGTRVADIVVEYPDLAPIYYELKSVKNLPPHDFVEQFSKDLSRPNFSIDNLRWVFDGKKITRQDLEKLRRDIEKALSGQFPTMPEKKKERFIKRILNKVFIVN